MRKTKYKTRRQFVVFQRFGKDFEIVLQTKPSFEIQKANNLGPVETDL
ncbi:hypothetical protein Pr1d_49190 [Bythopirellula goksoeyrii]|uniref:Uncharacterized protein n=1 Tax=Bythopirellula goksoeyrii TaxID=1400387 RepID=A0A5B9QUI2_9BACT|nr:hypothetical protein Pr1d_49190 [Bythopirellula goksoeyrii]